MKAIREWFERQGVTTVLYQPWQLGLFHPALEGKFVWYPEKGTLMAETKYRMGIRNLGYYETKEEVYEEIQRTINESLPEGW